MTADDQLAHALKLRFGLSQSEPTFHQLAAIKAAIVQAQRVRGYATDQDWRAAVASSCPTMGQWAYKGLDNSDLNTLLAMALQAAGGQG